MIRTTQIAAWLGGGEDDDWDGEAKLTVDAVSDTVRLEIGLACGQIERREAFTLTVRDVDALIELLHDGRRLLAGAPGQGALRLVPGGAA